MLSLNKLKVQGRSLCSSFLLANTDVNNSDDLAVLCAIGYLRLDWKYNGRTTCQKIAIVQQVEWQSDPGEERVFGQPVMSFRFPQDCPVNNPPQFITVDCLRRPLILITERREHEGVHGGCWRLIQYAGKGLGGIFTHTVVVV
jgi:hypothetical protein